MEINIDIPDDDEEFKEKKERLLEFFNFREDEALANSLEDILTAALHEYVDMIVGRGFPTSAEEIRQYRLFYLIKHYFKKLPTESKVSSMFKETQSKSKSLIRQVISRFRYDLTDEINQVLEETICSSLTHQRKDGKTEVRVTIYSDIIVEELNRIIEREAPSNQKIKRLAGTGRRYVITPDTYCELIKSVEPTCTDIIGCQEEE